MDIGVVKPISIEDEVRSAYLDYAMSVIVSRALPDARDGLSQWQTARDYLGKHETNRTATIGAQPWSPDHDRRDHLRKIVDRFPH